MTTLYRSLIESQFDGEAFLQVYWGRGSHIGEALERMLAAAWENGLHAPEPRELDPFDREHLEEEVDPDPDAEVFWSTTRYYYPPVETFPLPYGIIASGLEGEEDVDDIHEGFTIETSESGLTTLEVNVSRSMLLDIYAGLLDLCPSYRVFWYLIHDHWENREDQFLVNEDLNTPGRILDHLRDHANDSWRNGFVTLTAYAEQGRTNVNISDHKRIVVLSYDRTIAERHAVTLESLGIRQFESLVSIDCRMHHWHYRHPLSRTRSELSRFLQENGFRVWEPGG